MRKLALHYKRIVHAAVVAALLGTGTAAMAQAWPAKNISIVVPFATGGTTDAIARTLGQELSKCLGKPVIIENKPGAGATIGADYVAKAKPDGYTILLGAVHHTIATSVYKKLPYDFQRDLAPVSTVALVPNVLVVNPERPGEERQRFDCAGEEVARQADLRIERQRHRPAPDRRPVRHCQRRRHHARAL